MPSNDTLELHGIRPASLRAVVFDLGGVFLEGTLENVIKFGETIGLTAEIWQALRLELFVNGGPWENLERGEMTLDAFAEILREKVAGLGVSLTLEQARNFMGSPGEQDRMRLREEIVSACRKVKARLPTALLTNNVREWRAGWRSRLDVSALFDVVVDSSEVGMRKPEERIYRYTEEQLDLGGEHLLFIDDIGINLKAARQRGWQTLKYEQTATVLEVLEAVAAPRP